MRQGSYKRGWGIAAALSVAVLAFTSSAAAGGSPTTDRQDLDCADFSTQAEAQSYFVANGGSASNNFDNLDGDGNGIACEALPCPCSATGPAPPPSTPPTPGTATIISVTDGDTVKVQIGDVFEDVRLLGIDTPETFPRAECAGAKASASMKRLLQPGDEVRLVSDPSQGDRDFYGRLLRYVEHEGLDVGRRQVDQGWAKLYLDDPLFSRAHAYRRVLRGAERRNRGAWKRCNGKFHKPA